MVTESTIDSEGFKGGTRGAPIMPRDAVSWTVNIGTVGKNGLTLSFQLWSPPQTPVGRRPPGSLRCLYLDVDEEPGNRRVSSAGVDQDRGNLATVGEFLEPLFLCILAFFS